MSDVGDTGFDAIQMWVDQARSVLYMIHDFVSMSIVQRVIPLIRVQC